MSKKNRYKMIKKIFALLLFVTVISVASFAFAASEMQSSMDKAGSSIQDMVNGAGNVVRDGAEAIGNGARDIGEDISSGASDMMGDMTSDQSGNDGYSATRTSTDTDGAMFGMSANTWTWFILAIVAIAIVALVWYYATQNKNEYNNNTHND